MVKIDEKTEA
jgi:signal transduction histidine kinase